MARAWPRWQRSYTVMPHTYMRTWPDARGANGSRRRVRVLWIFRDMGRANNGSPGHGARPVEARSARPPSPDPSSTMRQYIQPALAPVVPPALRYDSQPRGPVVARFALRGSMQYPVITPLAARRASFTPSLRRLTMAAACAMVLAGLPALAQSDDVAEVNRLLRAGQYSEALGKADQALAAKPKDPQLRFLKGVIQTESGKTADAMVTFTKLTEDFPELPEPYNNLAVLYANLNQLEKARTALEMAVRTKPDYATAHENLGDIHAKLAGQSYLRAQQLDKAVATSVAPKLKLLRELFAATAKPTAPKAAAPASR